VLPNPSYRALAANYNPEIYFLKKQCDGIVYTLKPCDAILTIEWHIINHNSGYSRDIGGVGVAHDIKSPEHQPQLTIRQYWLVKTKLSDQPEMPSKSYYRILKNNHFIEFSTDWLTN